MASDTLTIEWVPIDRVHLSPSNPRLNDPAVEHVAASLRRFGWRQPIVAKPSGEVIAGNTRLKAALKLGMEKVPVHWFEGTDLDATAYQIADNRTAEFAEWDEPALAELLKQLRAEDALDGVGYDEADIDALLDELGQGEGPADVDDPGPEEPPEHPVSRTGDLWILGDHRLLCGDCTNADDVARVLDGARPGLMATDPPYCVDYTGADRPEGSGKDWSHVYREVDIEDLGQFLDAAFGAILPHLRDDAALYVWHAHVQQPVIAATFDRQGLLFHQVIIWAKPSSTFGHSYYRWKHEPCAFGWKKGHKPKHPAIQLETLWPADWEGKARIQGDHPTQKPLRLFEIPMEMHTRAGDVVFEPFSGSGSQLVAAEKLRRRCRALEICPAFVDVAVRRWERATGKQAVLADTDDPFDVIAERRQHDASQAAG